MPLQAGQPSIRFSNAGPFGPQGLSLLPKVITIDKVVTTVEETDDFLVVPAGTFIARAFAFCVNACDANTEVTLGTDGSPDALFTTTAFSVETVGNFAVFSTGLYLPSGDTLRLTVGGTAAEGQVRFVLETYEIPAMYEQVSHFSL
jgi:hypothetical protein